MVWDQKHSQSEDKWRKLYGPLGQWCPGKYHHTKICKQSFTACRTNYQPHGFQSCLHGARQCIHKTIGLHCDLGSVDRVQGYDEDQIALVIPDLSNFMAQIPVILGTATIGHVVNVMKEAEVGALTMPWTNARVAHLLLVHRMMPMEVDDGQKEEVDTSSYDQLMYSQSAETKEPFSSCIIPVKAGRVHMGECINIMVQAL